MSTAHHTVPHVPVHARDTEANPADMPEGRYASNAGFADAEPHDDGSNAPAVEYWHGIEFDPQDQSTWPAGLHEEFGCTQPNVPPTPEQVIADLEAKKQAAKDLARTTGIRWGTSRDGNGHRGYAVALSGRRIYASGRRMSLGDAGDEAIFLAGKLAAILNAGGPVAEPVKREPICVGNWRRGRSRSAR